jgi:DNA (cytosine-5)-methyltransferase 1
MQTEPHPLRQTAQPEVAPFLTCVELFAGCGGLALGLARAGFKHLKVIELDDQAHATLAANKKRALEHVAEWPLTHGDVADVDYSELVGAVDLVAGGPPCQPFSIGGKHLGPADDRNMWPEAIRAVRELKPGAFLFENVRGLLRPAWAGYLDYLDRALGWPSIAPMEGEDWVEHLARLQTLTEGRKALPREYRVVIRPINAADYGAPQKRHRAMVVGVRCDVASDWDFPAPTHSREALLWQQHVEDGDYWALHGLEAPKLEPDSAPARLLEKLRRAKLKPNELPWTTVRDALRGLPIPTTDAEPITHHRLRLGARAYKKHTGSAWDEPAKALKAGDHGVPGGENMLASQDGSVRYFTLREMARLQGFPDDFNFGDGWKRPIRQLGNAVPVQVGACFGAQLHELISKAKQKPVATGSRR